MNTNLIGTKVMVNLRDKKGNLFDEKPFEVSILGKPDCNIGDYQVVVTKITKETDKIPFYIYENEIIETL